MTNKTYKDLIYKWEPKYLLSAVFGKKKTNTGYLDPSNYLICFDCRNNFEEKCTGDVQLISNLAGALAELGKHRCMYRDLG